MDPSSNDTFDDIQSKIKFKLIKILPQALTAPLQAADAGRQTARGHFLLQPGRLPILGHVHHASGLGRGSKMPLLLEQSIFTQEEAEAAPVGAAQPHLRRGAEPHPGPRLRRLQQVHGLLHLRPDAYPRWRPWVATYP